MPQKRYRPEEIIAKLRQADVLLGEGKRVPEVVKALGIHEVTYYRWRKEGGGRVHLDSQSGFLGDDSLIRRLSVPCVV